MSRDILMECRKCGRWFHPYVIGKQVGNVAINSSICRRCRKKEEDKVNGETNST